MPTGERAYGDVVVTRDRVTTFVAATGIDHPLHADLAHCRRMGFDDVVVQGLELVDDVVRASGVSIGTVEAWFRKAVVAGETVALGSADDGVWTLRAAGDQLALVARRARRLGRSCGLGTIRREAGAVTADTAPVAEPLLVIRDFRTRFLGRSGPLTAVDGVDLAVDRGQTLGIVGESGSGKTVLARSIMGLLDGPAVEREGSVRFNGVELVGAPPGTVQALLGTQMAMIFQDPLTALNPVVKIGRQLTEGLRVRLGVSRRNARDIAIELLRAVGISEPARRLDQYPHEMSGGMRQRIVIAIALSCGPQLLFADEPTTALDVTVQAQILNLLADAQRDRHMAMVMITHDLGVMAGRSDSIAVMYAGQVVEQAPTAELFANVRMPYTEALLAAIPPMSGATHVRLPSIAGRPRTSMRCRPGAGSRPVAATSSRVSRRGASPRRGRSRRARLPLLVPTGRAGAYAAALATAAPQARPRRASSDPTSHSGRRERASPGSRGRTIAVDGRRSWRRRPPLGRVPRVPHGTVHAVSDVSFALAPGETLGLVGESGCGKSTTGKAIVQIVRPTAGRVLLDGVDLCQLGGKELRAARTGIQMIFQDPISSLNPKHTVADIVTEPLHVWNRGTKTERAATVAAMLEAVGLDPGSALGRRPHQFSGGQCQRISIARALVLEPKVIICDEPVSALDVSVQAQICNLLEDMKARFGLTLVFIAHDLAVVRNVSDRVAVMYLGRLCEVGRPDVDVPRARAPVHRRPAPIGARARPARPADSHRAADRRPAIAGRPAERVPLPHAMPAGRGGVRGRRATAATGRRRSRGRLPLPARADRRADPGGRPCDVTPPPTRHPTSWTRSSTGCAGSSRRR